MGTGDTETGRRGLAVASETDYADLVSAPSLPLVACWLGLQPYAEVYTLQTELISLRKEQRIPDVLLLLEHQPTITLGRGSHDHNLLASPRELCERGVQLLHTDRGGDVTLHAPGQLVCYPILDLNPDRRDVRKYVRLLADTMRHILSSVDLDAGRIERYIGVWVDRASPQCWPGEDHLTSPAKLGAIGVKISRWFTMHGFALNLSNELSLFELIVPCGISELAVSSAARLTGRSPRPQDYAATAHDFLSSRLARTPVTLVKPEEPPGVFDRLKNELTHLRLS